MTGAVFCVKRSERKKQPDGKHHKLGDSILHDSCTAEERKAAQQVIKTAQNIAGTHVQSVRDVRDVSDVRCLHGAQSSKRQHPAQPQPVHANIVWIQIQEHNRHTS